MGCSGSSSTRVIVSFIWGNSGSVLIKSLKLVLSYDPTNGILVKVPNDRMTESLLSWKNRKFWIEDLFITDFKAGKRFKCPGVKACFTISDYDQFEDLQEQDQLLNKIKEIHGKGIDTQKSLILLKSLRNDCKDLWDFAKDFWVKHKTLIQKSEIVHFGKNCLACNVENKTDPTKLQEFLRKKYKVSDFLKTKKDVKAKIVMETVNHKPHIVKLRKSTLLNFYVESQHLLEVQEEVKIYVFCWEDVPELSDPEFIKAEMQKMQSGTKLVYSDLQEEIDSLNNGK